MRRERGEEFVGDARAEHGKLGKDYLLAAEEPGLGADDVSRAAGGEEAADALAHGLGGGVSAAHLAEERGHFVRLEEHAGALYEGVFDGFAGRESLGDGLGEADALREARVGLARGVLADAALAEDDEVEVGVGAVKVGVAASGEVGEHGEGAGEGEDAVGAGARGDSPVGQFADEARDAGKGVGHGAGVGEALVLVGAFGARRGEWDFKGHYS